MNILFLTLGKIRDAAQTDIYSCLMKEFVAHGHDVYVVSPVEHRENKQGRPVCLKGMELHFAHIGNYFHTRWVEKGITTLLMPGQYIRVIKKELANVAFDMVLYSTPPVTFSGIVSYIKRRDHCKAYLMLKDIWPQSMVDLGTLKTTGLQGIVYQYFRWKERQIYRVSDSIGCMSPACARYVLKHNRYLKRDKVGICPNAAKLEEKQEESLSESKKRVVRNKYGIPVEKVVFLFGGNIGNGQAPDFLCDCIWENEKRKDSFLLFVGKGTYYEKMKGTLEKWKAKNSKIIHYLEQDKYLELVRACDVGLVVLDYRFTVPNCPSRLISYLENKKPVLLATDIVSDVGPLAEKHGYGVWCESNDAKKFISLMDCFMDADVRKEMGERGYYYLSRHYHTGKVYKEIMRCFEKK